jgi:aryl-alcohol dehydrogenase-like predicted oxidoreductase
METRAVGSLRLSVLGLGAGTLTDDTVAQVRPMVAAALESGVTYVDISNRPASSERLLGRVLRGHRDSVVIGTKFGSRPRPGVLACATPDYVRESVEASLRNLDTDRIDLYFLHRPDPATPIADTLGTLDELVRAGKLREIACSKFTAAQLAEADAVRTDGGSRFAAVENHCSLLDTGDVDTVLPLCAERGIAYLAYWPLSAGLLTGKYRQGLPPGTRFTRDERWIARAQEWHSEANRLLVERLLAWAQERGHSLVELAFAWLLAHPQLSTAIAGASSPEQVRANAHAAGAWRLTSAEYDEVTAIAQPAAQSAG